MPLAPVPEQHRIVEAIESYFTRLDHAVATLERVQRNLKSYRASVLKAAVEGRLVPTEAELGRAEGRHYDPATGLDVPDRSVLPDGWRRVSADAICGAVVSGSTPAADKLFSGDGEIPFIKVYNLTMTGQLDFTVKPAYVSKETHNGQLSRSRVYPGDVLTNIVGPPLGKVSVVSTEFPEWNINQAIAAFRPSEGVTTGWLRLVLMSAPAQTWLLGTAKTTTSQVNLAITNCRRLPIPLPPVREQVKIVSEADRLLSLTDETEADAGRQLLQIRRLRQSILKWAFEGRLVDQDPTDEPASVLLERIKAERAVSAETTKPNRKPRRKGNSANA
ncbi:MAG TPA: restriction endonuclease subunit S [Thermoanaerobaculia bacterium]|nr:restriction endonuclease subunit S [Thermoanaerobaculia bacterium]